MRLRLGPKTKKNHRFPKKRSFFLIFATLKDRAAVVPHRYPLSLINRIVSDENGPWLLFLYISYIYKKKKKKIFF